ncbi:hypothetical protein JCM16814_30730 [Desulfobaculum senezii]
MQVDSPMEQVREFYRALESVMDEAFAQDAEDAPRAAAEHHARLLGILQRQLGGRAASGEHEQPGCAGSGGVLTQYALAALADDLLLSRAWAGRAFWKTNLLEERLFGTRESGERIFSIADRLLQRRDAADAPLMETVLLVLGLGFKGRYAAPEDAPALAQYRRQLEEALGGARQGGEMLFADAYGRVLHPARTQNLPSLRRWWAWVAMVALMLVAVSHGVWVWETATMRQLLLEIVG